MRVATLLIPSGPVRERYRAELSAEQFGLTGREQAAQSLSVLAGAPRLHRALVEAGELTVPHSLLWCRLHLHHQWRLAVTADGERFQRCRACGMDDDGALQTGNIDGEGVGIGYATHMY